VGLLHSNTIQPEKSIHRFDPANFLEIMRVNAIVTPLLGKHFLQRFNADTITAFLSISAKVGSIDDNKMGGWHSYRASKAALNMLVKNLAIECKRKYKNCIVLAIHPGTTKTDLSSPFIDRTAYKVHTPFETAENIMNILKSTTLNDTGSFYSWNGSKISW
jgi:NAD(P)-dependent dehydrogenase (short-subunit alcohol dehydrogenase family)